MEYLYSFLIGGLICAAVQILLDRTKLMPGRVMVLLVCGGADQATETTVSCGGVTASAAAKPGCYGLLRMTVSHRGPEPLRLSITAGGQPWCVNLLLIQKDAAYL